MVDERREGGEPARGDVGVQQHAPDVLPFVGAHGAPGLVNPVEAIADVVLAAGRRLLIDAMSSFGALPLSGRAPIDAVASVLAYLDGALRQAGHVTEIWDARMAGESLEEGVTRFAPDFIGLSMRNIDNVQCHNPKSFIHDLVGFCRRLRAVSGAPLVLGGSGFSVFPREIFALEAPSAGSR